MPGLKRRSVSLYSLFCRGFIYVVSIYLPVLYVYWCPTWFPFLRVLQVEQELYILPEHMDSPRLLMGSCYSFCLIAHLHVFRTVLWCLHYFRVKTKISSSLPPFVLCEVLVFINVTRIYLRILVSNSNSISNDASLYSIYYEDGGCH